MYLKNIMSKVEFSSKKPVKKDIIKTDLFNVALVCLKEGQEIKPHPEDYSVFFLVLDGSGLFTSKKEEFELNKGDGLFVGADEIRGIKCVEDIIVLGIQDGH